MTHLAWGEICYQQRPSGEAGRWPWAVCAGLCSHPGTQGKESQWARLCCPQVSEGHHGGLREARWEWEHQL